MDDKKVRIRKYNIKDLYDIAHLYFDTIHIINARDYTVEQINAWAPYRNNYENWREKLERTQPLITVIDSKIVGFAEFEPNGYIDCFFVHHDFQRCGIGSALIREIENIAIKSNISRIYVEVSITAKDFFTQMGFEIIRQQTVTVRNIEMTNFVMEKNMTFKDVA
jgi:putative acetyltransferase